MRLANGINWQPIETAPKDGGEVQLALYDGDEYKGQVVAAYLWGEWLVSTHGSSSAPDRLIYEPLFWRQLYEPPKL